jgi:thioredoxin reductase
MSNSTYYQASATEPLPNARPLTEPVTADVCVIGGGYAGLAAALHLARQGASDSSRPPASPMALPAAMADKFTTGSATTLTGSSPDSAPTSPATLASSLSNHAHTSTG